jgi:outer membrane usher protein FimD/PapC
MSIKPCASHKKAKFLSRTCALVVILIQLATLPASLHALDAEMIIVTLRLNGEARGEFFVARMGDGDILIRLEDMRILGIADPRGTVTTFDNERYLSLRSLSGARFSLNEKNLSLEITVPPELLPKRSFDLMPPRPAKIYYPKDSSLFLNYRFNYAADDFSRFQNIDMTNQLGARMENFLFLTDSIVKRNEIETRAIRLMSQVIYDRRQQMQRLAFGDFIASSGGNLGSSANLGGVSFSKVYDIDPYFIKRPLLGFSGFASLPSEMELYIDGVLTRRERISPGGFEFKNILTYDGYRMGEVILRDAFGREERVRIPFYFTDMVLQKGLHEYSYNGGFLREFYGTESNSYGRPVLMAYHRYGVSNTLTLGFRTEMMSDLCNFGPQVSWLADRFGVIGLSVAGSLGGEDRRGAAASLNHSFQGREINTHLYLSAWTENYATAGGVFILGKPRYEAGAGYGYGSTRFGSISLDFTILEKYQEEGRKTVSLTYSRNLGNNISLSSTVPHVREAETYEEIFVSLNYYPGNETSLSTRYQKSGDAHSEVVQYQKNVPEGEGFGYRAEVMRTAPPAEYDVTPFVQYNGRHGIYTGEYRGAFQDSERIDAYYLSAAGSVAFVGGTVGFSRPINDSFGLVEVGDLRGVRVYRDNQEIGRTDASGKLFVPSLNAYNDNRLSISGTDIPPEYSMSEVSKLVSPPLHSGSVIRFEVKKFKGFAGILKIKTKNEIKPVELIDVKITNGEQEIAFFTGRGGEFYFEDAKPGLWRGSFQYMKKTCYFDMIVPQTDDALTELGEIIYEDIY